MKTEQGPLGLTTWRFLLTLTTNGLEEWQGWKPENVWRWPAACRGWRRRTKAILQIILLQRNEMVDGGKKRGAGENAFNGGNMACAVWTGTIQWSRGIFTEQ